jgi:serine/threonine protein phosphatase PrpC
MADESADVQLLAFGTTHVGMVRTNNEDSYIISDLNVPEGTEVEWAGPRPVGERGVLLAVSDGMGGAAAGEVASAMTVESLRQWLVEEHGRRGTDELIEEAIEEANRNVFDAAQDTERQGMGATLTAVLVRGPYAYIAEVGDSRAYIVRGGRIRQVTRDQSYVQLLVDQGLISPDQAEFPPYKNVILQAMGQRAHVDVAIGRLELRRGDRFLLCSDGLTGKVEDRELHDALAESESFEVACRRLINLANSRGGEDNITIVVAEVTGEALREAPKGENITRTLSDLKVYGEPAAAAAPPPPPAAAPGVASHITQILTAIPEAEPAAAATASAAAAPAAAAPAPAPAPAAPASSPFPPPGADRAPVEASRSFPWVWVVVVAVIAVLAVVGVMMFSN